ncbi:hypothetical protein OKW96_05605 [Sphingobacterium sp. KU25419]|nr:hypothetical protein OKW96_05605 [Sphingobacterium sp. KU25419]
MLLVAHYDVFGLENKDFNQHYEQVSLFLLAYDIKQAQIVADSLRAVAVNDEQRIRANMLSAKVYFAKGDVGDAIKHAMKANEIAHGEHYTKWQTITSGFLATAFRVIGLLKASERYLTIAQQANEAAAQEPLYMVTKTNLLHEGALHRFNSKDFTAAETMLQEARQFIVHDLVEREKSTLLKATNSLLLGYCYLHLDQLALADDMLQETLQLIGDVKSDLLPYTYWSIAEIEMKKGNLQKAYDYLNLTLPYLESLGVDELKAVVYQSFVAYYLKLGDLDRSNNYSLKAIALEKIRSIWQSRFLINYLKI